MTVTILHLKLALGSHTSLRVSSPQPSRNYSGAIHSQKPPFRYSF